MGSKQTFTLWLTVLFVIKPDENLEVIGQHTGSCQFLRVDMTSILSIEIHIVNDISMDSVE